MHEALPWLVCWALRADRRYFCPAMAALVGPVEDIFFFVVHYFNSFFSIAQQAWQAVMQSRLSLKVCLGFYLRYFRDCSFFLADSIIERYCENRMSFRLACAFSFMHCHLELTNFPFRKHYTKSVSETILPWQIKFC
jgi:hypothetical protein